MPKTKSNRPSARASIETERRRLMRASAILTAATLAADHDADAGVIGDCAHVARELVDAAVAALDSVTMK